MKSISSAAAAAARAAAGWARPAAVWRAASAGSIDTVNMRSALSTAVTGTASQLPSARCSAAPRPSAWASIAAS
ncbi:hypothetical protein [Piscinibacter sp.]|uniref:hypothetical protein n=1 Tax=Piscinibacter sp. TaxID=1903157 RepID=UPI002BE7F207|nr:hypothetical protein [Albitalea sp.]HUG21558.1 hypothetical protein [Albitalea sp.]